MIFLVVTSRYIDFARLNDDVKQLVGPKTLLRPSGLVNSQGDIAEPDNEDRKSTTVWMILTGGFRVKPGTWSLTSVTRKFCCLANVYERPSSQQRGKKLIGRLNSKVRRTTTQAPKIKI